MLTIGKPVQFDDDGMAAAGQYDQSAPDWRLRWFSRGQETVLYSGSLMMCRRYQYACRGLTDLAAIRRVLDGPMVGDTVEMPALTPMPTEAYAAVEGMYDDGDPTEPTPRPVRKRKKRRTEP